jgi:ABC-2 type transport system permease protein
VLKNLSDTAIRQIHLNVAPEFATDVQMDRGTLKTDDRRLYYRIFELNPPLQPAESITMRYTVRHDPVGFENQLRVAQVQPNGTFFNSGVVPQLGYQDGRELSDKNDRRKKGLPEKELMPALERNCTDKCRDNYLGRFADWVDVETVISTSPDQIAVAPGSLLREWSENGRRYFHYKLDHPSLNFYSFISARYEVAREQWNGVSMEVYYHPEHKWNVPKMLNGIRKALDYCSTNFAPYPHRQARIIEFPRVASFAQAFPGTMPYSESIGFIADLHDTEDIDQVLYVVAHEIAHQWWAHQVVGAKMQGATLLSETLAQYSALMTMEKEYGRDMMRKFLSYEMDRYLRGRGRELLKERPLARVEASQGYIHYNKGSVVMYYLREMIGEDAVNRALRKVMDTYRYAPPPYPTSYALLDALREQTPPNLHYLLQDAFYDITLFSNRTLDTKAVKRADGKYDVSLSVESKKFKADETGNEKEVPLDDYIDIGAFSPPPSGKKYGRTLYRERIRITKPLNEYKFVTAELPQKAGIDPFSLLVDRMPDDNLKKVEVQ